MKDTSTQIISAARCCGHKVSLTLLPALLSLPLMAEVVELKPTPSPAAISAVGKIQQRWPVNWKITDLLPGDESREWKASMNLQKKPLASLTLGLRVIHPLPNGKPLRFANAEQDHHALGWLSLGPLP